MKILKTIGSIAVVMIAALVMIQCERKYDPVPEGAMSSTSHMRALAISQTLTVDGVTTLKARVSMGAMQAGVAFGSNELIEIHAVMNSATADRPVLRVRVDNEGTAGTAGQNVWAIQGQGYSASDAVNVYGLLGVKGEVGFKADGTELITGGVMMGGYFKIEDLGFNATVTGDAFSIQLGSQFNAGSTISGEHAFIWMRNEGGVNFQPEAIIYHTDGSSSSARTDFFIKSTQGLGGSDDWISAKALTASGALNGSTLNNDVAVQWSIDGTDYWFPGYIHR